MAAKSKTQTFETQVIVNNKPTMQYVTKVDGKAVEVLHAFRRQYTIRIDGHDKGYITARNVMNAVGRVETAGSIKALKEMLL